jgi:hypothetical protein
MSEAPMPIQDLLSQMNNNFCLFEIGSNEHIWMQTAEQAKKCNQNSHNTLTCIQKSETALNHIVISKQLTLYRKKDA